MTVVKIEVISEQLNLRMVKNGKRRFRGNIRLFSMFAPRSVEIDVHNTQLQRLKLLPKH